MTAGYRIILGIVLLFFICTALCIPALAAPLQPAVDVKAVTVVLDNNYPPFSFRDANGELVGISVDMWRLWEKQTGRKVNITALSWDEATSRMEAGEFDVIDTVMYTEDRARIYDFTPPYTDVDVVIFFKNEISGISGPNTLEGFVVGMGKGDSTAELIKKKGVTVREFESYEAVVMAAKNGEIVVFVLDKPSGLFLLYQQRIQDQFRYTSPVITGSVHRAVKKGNSALLDEINAGFQRIPKSEYEALDRKWYGTPLVSTEYLQYILFFAGAVIIVITGLVVWNQTLKKKVAQRTQELDAELIQRRKAEEELTAANEKLTATAEELKYNYDELHMSQQALTQARKKLNLLNTITFQDIQNALFSLAGYLELQKDLPMDEKAGEYVKKEREVAEKISNTLAFARNYQDMGIKPPFWQNTNQVFLIAISHLDLSKIARKNNLDNLELYADPLLETVFFNLAENVMRHGKTATEITLNYRETTESLTLYMEDNGAGIPDVDKEKIFERGYGTQKGMGLFLVREILGITDISIKETGTYGNGARFEITVPKGAYRFSGTESPPVKPD